MSETALHRVLELPWVYRLTQKILAPGADERITRSLRELFNTLPPARTLLDVGCGPNSWLWRLGQKPVGLDVSPAYTAAFRQKNGGAAVVGSATTLPFADSSFDGVWCIGVLHHLPDSAAAQAIKEMLRVCRPGGYTAIFDGVLPESGGRRPVAWAIRQADRGSFFRSEENFRRLLPEARWTARRITYASTRLEAMLCSAVKSPVKQA